MNEVVRLLGVEKRSYTDKDSGQPRTFCGLHVVYELVEQEIFAGKRVDSFSCPHNVNPDNLEVGKCYELEWAHFKTRTGTGARIDGLNPVDE